MNELNRLRDTLRPHLPWHGARLNFVCLFLMALFQTKTVNLMEIATVFANPVQISSNYQRLQRFFRQFKFDRAEIARFVVSLIDIPQPWTLSLDRTCWSFGQTHFNILMLAVVHEGIAFPLLWTMLDKKGNSNSGERMDLFDRFEALFPDVEVACLTADREFVGRDWLSYLLIDPEVPFRLRIRHSELISPKLGGTRRSGERIFDSLRPGEFRQLSGRRWVWGRQVYVIGSRLADSGELLILITNACPETALPDYARRWGIENLFGALKTRGFCLESTHFKDPERLSRLLALLSLAFTWAMKVGLWIHQGSPIPLKAHGRRSQSLFRTGFDFLRRTFSNLPLFSGRFHQALQLLSCT
ncbi:transposase IS4 family protein [Limnospira maxima CS-328]|uniref:Transposase IS4 family protein n=2 Tax=Limnospira TaxID=2596745 RepID=B5VUH2_LIMMA|nr:MULTISPECIES: IS4-like element ISAtsp3 family transposase [Limnospira]EDZ97188.1 transposase IS4 family protein [Limnospira maxima CS-328]QNH58549.1 MAG: IS4-like element ISAtsp3 family transposase [Limnospira indica BM01]